MGKKKKVKLSLETLGDERVEVSEPDQEVHERELKEPKPKRKDRSGAIAGHKKFDKFKERGI